MKLLLDQNLSRKLPAALRDLYSETVHVRSLGMTRSPDTDIWQYAKQNGFMIATKDSWFSQRSLVLGHPPKIVWTCAGNCSSKYLEELLRRNAIRIQDFADDPDAAYIALE